jgi:hypothetical protein
MTASLLARAREIAGRTGDGNRMETAFGYVNVAMHAANRAHAQLRSPSERANAQLKTWHILPKLRCCPWKAGQLARPSTSFGPTRSQDEKGSVNKRTRFGTHNCPAS